MKTITGCLLILSLFSNQVLAQEAAIDAGRTNTSQGKVKEFYKDKTSCYCTQARSVRLKLTSSGLKGIDIIECGEKNLVRIEVPPGALNPRKSEACAVDTETHKKGFDSCWIKKNYIKYTANCNSKKFAGDPNVENRPLCKDLGSVVGAGSCRKTKQAFK